MAQENVPAEAPADYEQWTVEQVKAWAANASDREREAAIAYETANQNRKEFLAALGATGTQGVPASGPE